MNYFSYLYRDFYPFNQIQRIGHAADPAGLSSGGTRRWALSAVASALWKRLQTEIICWLFTQL